MSAHLPSLDALESHDDDRLRAELRLARLRSQVAVVRTIADEVEVLARAHDTDGLRAELIEEMSRLGCSSPRGLGLAERIGLVPTAGSSCDNP